MYFVCEKKSELLKSSKKFVYDISLFENISVCTGVLVFLHSKETLKEIQNKNLQRRKMFSKVVVIFCVCLDMRALSLPVKTHPPVWEYTYQFQLFEKIYAQVQYLQREVKKLSGTVLNRRCPVHWKNGINTCYFLALHRKLDWFQSQEACERLGGHLAVLESEQEDTFISQFILELAIQDEMTLNDIWIGGFHFEKPGAWRWVTGSNMSYVKWEADPEVSERGQQCILLADGNWDVSKCSREFHYLCEKEPTFY